MTKTGLGATFIVLAAVVTITGAASPPRTSAGSQAAERPSDELLARYCVTCHNPRLKTGGLSLDPADLASVEARAETWEKVVRKLRTGMMPPAGAPRPLPAALQAFTSRLEAQLDAVARPDPGAPALHRLNRAEYSNVIRDLLALEIDATTLLPPDDAAAGFDNIADVLVMSPALIEGYATAAAKISRLAVGDPAIGLDRVTYRAAGDLSQEEHVDGLPLGTRGGMIVRHTFPLDAEYDLQIGPGRAGGLGAVVSTRPDDIDVTIDGVRIDLEGKTQLRLTIPAGPHTIAIAVLQRSRVDGADGVYQVRTRRPGISTDAAWIAKLLFVAFLVLAIVSFLTGRRPVA